MNIAGFEITGYQVAFVIIAAVTMISAAMVVLLPNILRAALFLGLALVGVAGLYVLLNAPFLAAAQVMVYVGGVTTMIILAIFLSHKVMEVKFSKATYNPIFAGLACGVLGLFLLVAVAASQFLNRSAAPGPAEGTGIEHIGQSLLQPHAFPFILASIILTAVIVVVAVIAKEDDTDES
jgi:NAD(P)H-quinone oxidoreductase subunit 6